MSSSCSQFDTSMFSGDMRASSSEDNLIENMRKVSNAYI